MRFSCIIVFLLCSLFVEAQDSPLDRKITISYSQETVGSVLKQIEVKAGCFFSYSSVLFDTQRKVTGTFNQATVYQILQQVFNQQLQYKVKGNYIILQSKPPLSNASSSYYYIDGYVIDGITGDRIPEVSIYDPNHNISTISSKYGYYQLKLNKGKEVTLIINKRAYQDTIIYLGSKEDITLNVVIYPSAKSSIPDSATDTVETLVPSDSKPFVEFIINKEQRAHIKNIQDTLHRAFHFSFLPFVGTNGLLSGNVVNDYSLNAIGGYSLGVRKLEVGGLFNVNRGSVKGLQVAGLINANAGSMHGVQISGNLNLNRHHVSGVEIGGLMNVNADSASVVSIAGLVHIGVGEHKGLQISGLANHQYKKMNGVQIAGLYNISASKINGSQIAGLLNVANKISGSQIGFINIADSCRGPQIGFLSIARKGYHALEIYADEVYSTNASLRTGTRIFYNIFSVGIQPGSLTSPNWQYGYGVGSSLRVSKYSWINFDFTANQMMIQSEMNELNMINRFIVSYEQRITKGIAVAAGPSVSLYVSSIKPDVDNSTFHNLLPRSIYEPEVLRNVYSRFWIGWKVGLRLL